MTGKFIWTDLSTFDVGKTQTFYQKCFGWQYETSADNYTLCYANGKEAAALYPMPAKFQKFNLPSFWMSYIQVDDLDRVVAMAQEMGGIIEVRPEVAFAGDRIALIRDPAGAGFTCYEGANLNGRDQSERAGRFVWNELHVSDLATVQPFYEALFDWTVVPSGQADRYDVVLRGETIAAIQVMDNAVKGDKEYWAVYFSAENLPKTLTAIKQAGGTVGYQSAEQTLVYDPQGAFFFLLPSAKTPTQQPIKWRTILGLILVLFAVLFNLNWFWGLLFLLWVIPDLRSGTTHFLEPIARQENPILYWLIMGSWLGLSLYSLIELLL